MRVVGGQHRGRRLAAPRGRGTRPTSDRVREALFSVLEARFGTLQNASVLDLFAGSGALGIEALSRGAATATFVETDPLACRIIAQNLAALGLTDRGAIVRADALRLSALRLSHQPFSLLLADPPYRIEPQAVLSAIQELGATGHLSDGAVVVYEHDASHEVSWPELFDEAVVKTYGSTGVAFARWKGSGVS